MKKTSLFCLLIIYCFAQISNAQTMVEGLLINEVYFNENDPSENWLEIYNQTKEPLMLSVFAISNYLTPNLLEGKEIMIEKKGYIILCADELFKNKIKKNRDKVIVMKELKMIDTGGLITIGTKEKGLEWFDTIKYGEDIYAARVKQIINKKVLPFSDNGNSFSRKTDIDLLAQSDFYETIPTPLEKNK